MRAPVWVGDFPVTQPWGVTDLLVEPYWPAAQAHFHCGIDLGLPMGTALYALRAGHLTARGTGYLGILTPSGEVDWYLHGVYVPIGFGAFVAAGQHLGSSSNVAPSGGFVTGPHLHFEVQDVGGRLNNPATSMDPVPFLAGRFGLPASTVLEAFMTALSDAQQLEMYQTIKNIAAAIGTGPGETLAQDFAAVEKAFGIVPGTLTAPYDPTKNPSYIGWSRDVTAALSGLKAAIGAVVPGTLSAEQSAELAGAAAALGRLEAAFKSA